MTWDLETETQHLFALILLLNIFLYTTYYVLHTMLHNGKFKKKIYFSTCQFYTTML